MDYSHKIIITGAPGSGKTTLINSLRDSGYICFEEAARLVIKEELAAGTDHLPWMDNQSFSNKLVKRLASDAEKAGEHRLCFLDRSAIDVIGYLRKDGLPTVDIEQSSSGFGYHTKVLFSPFWPEIYSPDNERRETAQQAQEITDLLKNTYLSLGYELLELPKVSVKQRLAFVQQWLQELK